MNKILFRHEVKLLHYPCLGLFLQILLILTNLILPEFINLVSSESNEVCNREEKRTIAPEHVIKALEVFSPLNKILTSPFTPMCEQNISLYDL